MNKSQITLIIVGFFILALMATNPTIEDHREGVKKMYIEKIEKINKKGKSELGTQIGIGIASLIGDDFINKIVSRDNYLLFSLTKISLLGKSKHIGFGIFGQVFIKNYDNIEFGNSSSNLNKESENIMNYTNDIQKYIESSEFNELKNTVRRYKPNKESLYEDPFLNDFENSIKENISFNWINWNNGNNSIILFPEYIVFSYDNTASIYNTQMSTLVYERSSMKLHEYPCHVESISNQQLKVYFQESDNTGQYIIKKSGILDLVEKKINWTSQTKNEISINGHAPPG